jgi:enamine deaminase RidA (YjgF/YER057c/UK114 family)
MDIQRINPREWNCNAAVFGDLVFCSGMVADDKSLDMKGQTAQVLQKIDAVLAQAGTNKSRILSATVAAGAALKDAMNEGLDGLGGSAQFADQDRRRRGVDAGPWSRLPLRG